MYNNKVCEKVFLQFLQFLFSLCYPTFQERTTIHGCLVYDSLEVFWKSVENILVYLLPNNFNKQLMYFK